MLLEFVFSLVHRINTISAITGKIKMVVLQKFLILGDYT